MTLKSLHRQHYRTSGKEGLRRWPCGTFTFIFLAAHFGWRCIVGTSREFVCERSMCWPLSVVIYFSVQYYRVVATCMLLCRTCFLIESAERAKLRPFWKLLLSIVMWSYARVCFLVDVIIRCGPTSVRMRWAGAQRDCGPARVVGRIGFCSSHGIIGRRCETCWTDFLSSTCNRLKTTCGVIFTCVILLLFQCHHHHPRHLDYRRCCYWYHRASVHLCRVVFILCVHNVT